MNLQKFILGLFTATALSAVLVGGLNLFPKIAAAQVLSWSTIIVFFVLSVLIYISAYFTAKQKNKHLFTGVISMVIFFKMALCIILVGIYVKSYQPTDNYFLIPFFSIYLIYTIFEVHLMTRLGKND